MKLRGAPAQDRIGAYRIRVGQKVGVGRFTDHRVRKQRRLRRIDTVRPRRMGASGPIRRVSVSLVAPAEPALARAPREQFDIRTRTARLDQLVLLIGFAAVFPLPRDDDVFLPPALREGTRVPSVNAEQDDLRYVSEVEADATPIRSAVLAYLVPDEVGLVFEPPLPHDLQSERQQRIGNPQVKVRRIRNEVRHGQGAYFIERHRGITRQPLVLGRHLPGLVVKPPRRIRQDRRELATANLLQEIVGRAHASSSK